MRLDAAKIRKIRESKKMTQQDIADGIGQYIGRRAFPGEISNLENDKRDSPGFVYICAIARVLDVDAMIFLDSEEAA